ncbi:MAG: hypothetical protein H6865_06065 [Rhodospirillales bacterium]|nr:hypothetical protein [Alphaproteobacteria bacterium]MCB9987186.1 hypothetical protein [Rhodospirillales bacterium]USO07951.1 MAG: hypothetical protein H6866_01635 [Rhodospirillales bacterium]
MDFSRSSQSVPPVPRAAAHGFLCGLAALCGVALVAWVFYFCGRGLDFTDEGFYLTGAAHPQDYAINMPLSFFGFVYHPLYLLAQGDIALYRRANVVITYALAVMAAFQVLRTAMPDTRRGDAVCRAIGLGAAAMGVFTLGLVTPNYNTLALQGLLVTLWGVMQALRPDGDGRAAITGWAMIGLGGWLTCMGKPSSAALLALAVPAALYAMQCRSWRYLPVAVTIAGGLLAASALAIDGSFGGFVARITHSLDAASVLGSGQDLMGIFRIDGLVLSKREYLFVALGAGATIGGAWIGFVPAVVGAGVTALIGAMIAGVWLGGFRGTVMLASGILAGAGWAVYAFARRMTPLPWPRPVLTLGLFLMALPYIYAFGTNGNYWERGAEACVFWALGCVVLLTPLRRYRETALFVPVFVLLFWSGTMIHNGIRTPYRQPESLRAMRADTAVGGGHLMLTQGFHDYFAAAAQVAQANGFTPGTPVIDLTGQSPTTIFALGGRALGQPWLVGAYPGSDGLAVMTLKDESCADLARAWLLVEPGGPRALDGRAVMAAQGAHIDSGYAKTAEFATPSGAGGFAARGPQYFLKPTRGAAQARAACEQAKGTQP